MARTSHGLSVALAVAVTVATLSGVASSNASTGTYTTPAGAVRTGSPAVCPDTVTIAARGTGEKPKADQDPWDPSSYTTDTHLGMGFVGFPTAEELDADIGRAGLTERSQGLIYRSPAVMELFTFWKSDLYDRIDAGANALVRSVKHYSRCRPATTLNLVGYSAGAWVVRVAMLRLAARKPALLDTVGGIALFGDPTYDSAESIVRWEKPTLRRQGVLRIDVESAKRKWLEPYPKRIRSRVSSYCLKMDVVCRAPIHFVLEGVVSGLAVWLKDHMDGHLSYKDKHTRLGADWLARHLPRRTLDASGTGLGSWNFGDAASRVRPAMTRWFGAPDADTGLQKFVRLDGLGGWYESHDPLAPSWDYRWFRATCWDSLCVMFGGPRRDTTAFRGWELAQWSPWRSYNPSTAMPRVELAGSEIALWDTWAEFSSAYPGATVGGGEGSSLVIDNPPWPGIFDGVWGWRLTGQWDFQNPGYAPPGAKVQRMSGGEGPEPGCC